MHTKGLEAGVHHNPPFAHLVSLTSFLGSNF